MKALVIDCCQDAISAAQLDPFRAYGDVLRRRVNLEVEYIAAESFDAIRQTSFWRPIDSVFLLPSWRETAEDVERTVEFIRRANRNVKILFIDPFGQVSSRYFSVLPYVDRFLKRQCYRDLANYERSYAGGTMFTEFLVNRWHFDLDGWHVGSKIPWLSGKRIVSGWNLGAASRFRGDMSNQRVCARSFEDRNIGVFCRLALGSAVKREWYYRYRMAALEAVQPLSQKYEVAASGGFDENKAVSESQYYNELERSRIVFSPFGWGENCWRDFEAICYGCLLIKPSMAHIDTRPDIFVDGETYVSVRWDFADLEEKCCYYLENPDAATRIIENGRRVYSAYFEQNEFVKTVARLMNLKMLADQEPTAIAAEVES